MKFLDIVTAPVDKFAGVYPVTNLPPGELMEIPGRGTTFVTDSGPRDAPVVFLLHAVVCTGLMSWYPTIPAINDRFRVITLDQRWHGQGIFSPTFELEDCADDVAALADLLGIDRFFVAGFSMGGFVSQLVWHQHPDRVRGMVLSSTAPFVLQRETRNLLTPLLTRLPGGDGSAQLHQAGRVDNSALWLYHQWRSTPASRYRTLGNGLARFDSRHFLPRIKVPVAVTLTTKDKVILPSRQGVLSRHIRNAATFPVEAGHACCTLGAEKFVPVFADALDFVYKREQELAEVS